MLRLLYCTITILTFKVDKFMTEEKKRQYHNHIFAGCYS
jgi:hypothetical protein